MHVVISCFITHNVFNYCALYNTHITTIQVENREKEGREKEVRRGRRGVEWVDKRVMGMGQRVWNEEGRREEGR